MSDEKRIVEIAGVKVEVDLRTAKTIESYKVGDSVKVLKKQYGDSWVSHLGVIIGFADFKTHPAIEILTLTYDYNAADLSVLVINAQSTDCEIAPFNQCEATFTREDVLRRVDREIEKHEEVIRSLKTKRDAFDKYFGKLLPEKQ